MKNGEIYGIVIGSDLASSNIFVSWYKYGRPNSEVKTERLKTDWVDKALIKSKWTYSEELEAKWKSHPHYPYIINSFVLPIVPFDDLKSGPWCLAKYEPEQGAYYTKIMPYPPAPLTDDDSEEEDDDMCDECGVYQHEMKMPWNQNGLCPICEREEDEKEKAQT